MNNRPGKIRFTPTNKEKYKGDIEKIQIRSKWEEQFCRWLDTHQSVIEWNSENIVVPYFDPVKNKERRYFPDFFAKMKTKQGKIVIYLIEIKPYKETVEPIRTKRKTKRTLLKEMATWETNKAKFRAANMFCMSKNWIFKIMTEKELFGK